jgi:hypothetical protein
MLMDRMDSKGILWVVAYVLDGETQCCIPRFTEESGDSIRELIIVQDFLKQENNFQRICLFFIFFTCSE